MAECPPHSEMEPPIGAASDWTVPQDWLDYDGQEHRVWDTLFARQMAQLQDRATPAFLEGVAKLGLETPGIPNFERLNERLMAATGWQVVAVPGLIPDDVFFDHLANRRFVAGNFIRRADQLDYLQEPDVFHDVFGHVPLLADPVFADYMQAYGKGGQRAAGKGMLKQLARLYWYTVEFGLIREGGALRLFGAGIVSSHGESVFALDDPSPNRLGFDLQRIMRTDYRIDDYQQVYFVIDSFEQLLDQTLRTDFGPLYKDLQSQADIGIENVLPDDVVIWRGSQHYARSRVL